MKEEVFWKLIEEEPKDPLHKLALADFYEESGEEPELVAGLRWCAERGKYPIEPNYGVNYTPWYTWYHQSTSCSEENKLPGNIFDDLIHLPPTQRWLDPPLRIQTGWHGITRSDT